MRIAINFWFYAPYLSIAQANGYCAVQSTPIIRSDGVVIGVLSTHFAQTHEWSDAAQRALDNHADQWQHWSQNWMNTHCDAGVKPNALDARPVVQMRQG